jgi:hypothetical protein
VSNKPPLKTQLSCGQYWTPLYVSGDV